MATAADTRKRATRVKAGTLLAALKDVNEIVEARTTVPICANVLIEVIDGRISLSGTDLDRWAVRTLASDDRDGPASADWIKSIRPFTITLPAKPLQDVVAAFNGDAMVTIASEDGSGKAKISAGKSTFRLSTLPPDDFPPVPPMEVESEFVMACSALADAFAAVEHAISTEETRYYLNGIYLHPCDEDLTLRLAATDGHRLARLKVEPPEGALTFPQCIVSRHTIAALDKLLGAAPKPDGDAPPAEVAVVSSGNLISFDMPAKDGGEVRLVAKVIDGTFPDYARVIPTAPEHRAVIARLPLAEAIKRVSTIAPKESRAVKASFTQDRVTLRVVSAELGEATEELACVYDGPEIDIGFNGVFWRSALGALACDEVAMAFDDAGGPCRVRAVEGADGSEGERLVQVLMPMRV